MSSYREMTVTPYTSFWHVNPLHDPREALIIIHSLEIEILRQYHVMCGTFSSPSCVEKTPDKRSLGYVAGSMPAKYSRKKSTGH